MTPVAIESALQTHFNTNWTTTSIRWPNIPFKATKTAYVTFTLRFGTSANLENATTGIAKRNGVLMLQVFTPRNQGSSTGATHAGTIEALYMKTDISNVHFDVPYTTDDGETPDKLWYQHTVVCPFWTWLNE